MNLWVRSQDKQSMYNTMGVKYYQNRNSQHFIVSDRNIALGKYATKARCIEILDEIQQMIDDAPIFIKNASKLDKDELERVLSENIKTVFYNDEVIPIKTLVYQMPKK